jgi:hypothetical protein
MLRIAGACLLWIVAFCLAELVTTQAQSLNSVLDTNTGVRLRLPSGVTSSRSDTGRNWRSPDGRLDIDALKFNDRTLGELYRKLRDKTGRSITKDVYEGDHFILEGLDSKSGGDRNRFYVEARERVGEIRGLSIVYSAQAQRTLVQAIVRSFEPFPGASPVTVGGPVTRPPDLGISQNQLERQITDLNERIRQRDQELERLNEKIRQQDQQREQQDADRRRIERDQAIRLEEQEKARKEREALQKALDALLDRAGQTQPQQTATLPGKRVAFVLGVNKYSNLSAASQLKTAVNDARMITETLKKIGFQVIEAEDLPLVQFYQKWNAFLKQVDSETFAAFFFAGHGVQINNSNLLLASDAPDLSMAENGLLQKFSIRFSELMDELRARKPKLSLMILDACRDNPYSEAGTRSPIASSRGLARVEAALGTFVMYSAGEGQKAFDFLPDDPPQELNSVYTRKLVPLLVAQGLSLQSVAQRVRAEVQQLVAPFGIQTPAYYDNVVGSVCLSGTCSTASAR